MDFELLFKFASYPVLLSELTFKPYSFFSIKILSLNTRVEVFASRPALGLAAETGFLRAQDAKVLSNFEKEASKVGADLISLEKNEIERLSKNELLLFLQEFEKKANAFFGAYLFTEYPFFKKVEQLLLEKVSAKELFSLLSSNRAPKSFSISEAACLKYLRRMQNLKLDLRKKYFNATCFGPNSLYARTCNRLVELTGRNDVQNMTVFEIELLFEGKKTPPFNERARSSVVEFLNGETVVKVGIEAEREIKALQKPFSLEEFFGNPTNTGIVSGKAVVISLLDSTKLRTVLESKQKNFVLIADSTGPEFVPLFANAAAVVADEGGLMSHAAVLSREFGIPGVVGTKHATKAFKDGDLIEVNGFTGKVKKLK